MLARMPTKPKRARAIISCSLRGIEAIQKTVAITRMAAIGQAADILSEGIRNSMGDIQGPGIKNMAPAANAKELNRLVREKKQQLV